MLAAPLQALLRALTSSPPLARLLQVMPQLLNYLGLDEDDSHALDWGTIAVYSCKASCHIEPSAPVEGSSASSAYAEEFVWVQGSN